MIYIFTFLGEFGYELLNWQGVIRKFARTIGPSDRVICCSRAGLYPLYETADGYIDISKVKLFEKSVACIYYALASPSYVLDSRMNLIYARQLKAKLSSFILRRLKVMKLLDKRPSDSCRFIFSSDRVELNGCIFGARRSPYDPEYDIYECLDLDNNIYKKIEPDFSISETVEKKLGWRLKEPFILCQGRKRSDRTTVTSKDTLPSERLIRALAREIKVVLLSFSTGREFDSYSEFKDVSGAYLYPCSLFPEQALLIQAAANCLFFTEGDFGSHIYLPPFMGRDVTAIAPWTVYQLGSTPIDFWNQNIFRFGGRIIPAVSEEVFASESSMSCIKEAILSRSQIVRASTKE